MTDQNSGDADQQAVEDEAAALLAVLPRDHLATFLPTVGQLTREMIAEIQQAVPAYQQPLEGHFGTIMVAGVEHAVRRLIDSVGVGYRPDSTWANLFRKLGRVEFHEGRSLDSLQTAYRIGGRVAWRHIADWGMRQRLPMASLSVLAEAIFAYIDEISRLSIDGYTKAQSESAIVAERKRRKLTELLLDDVPAALPALQKLAAAAGWRLPERVAVVVVESGDDDPPPVLPAEVLADPYADPLPLITADPQRHVAELAKQLGGRRACVGPLVLLTEVPASLRLARRGLDLQQRGLLPGAGPVAWCDEHLPTLCMLSDEFLIGELLTRTLKPLQRLTAKQRERTADTMLAWLDSRGNVPDVASRLRIHPQTVRYRMRLVDELFGDALDDPDRRLDLQIALRADAAMHAAR